jgi:TolB-like protein/Flp pilus assembly protein TadD
LESSGVPELDRVIGGGYPSPSAILVEGQVELGKERLLYRFLQSQASSDYRIFVTNSSRSEIVKDAEANGVDLGSGMAWIAKDGGEASCNIEDLASLSFSLKDLLRRNEGRPARIAFTALSPILMRNSSESVYKFLDQLVGEIKQHQAVLLATFEQGMHPTQVAASMEQLFDGVISMEIGEKGNRTATLLRVRKMKGVAFTVRASALLSADEGNTLPVKVDRLALDKRRIAVLPFKNLSPDPDDEYFSDGLTEEMISTVSKISNLSVISRTSAMHYKNSDAKLIDIAEDLEVGTVLEGSVRKAGNRVRISTLLIDVDTDSQLWGETYDRDMESVFDIQSEIAHKVAESLTVQLSEGETERIRKAATDDPQAHIAYLKGRFHWNERTLKGFQRAIEYFQDALSLDPNYALAYTGLADCYSVMTAQGWMETKQALAKAMEYASKAIEIDNGVAEAHATVAFISNVGLKFARAEREFRTSLILNPNLSTTHLWYSIHKAHIGEYTEAMAEGERAKTLDPYSLQANVKLAYVYFLARENEKGIAQAKSTLEMEPQAIEAHVWTAMAYAEIGMFDEAIPEAQIAYGAGHPYGLAGLGYAYAVAGMRTEAFELINQAARDVAQGKYVDTGYPAIIYSRLGMKDEAFQYLEKAISQGSTVLPSLHTAPWFESLRSDERFSGLLEKLGLVQPR